MKKFGILFVLIAVLMTGTMAFAAPVVKIVTNAADLDLSVGAKGTDVMVPTSGGVAMHTDGKVKFTASTAELASATTVNELTAKFPGNLTPLAAGTVLTIGAANSARTGAVAAGHLVYGAEQTQTGGGVLNFVVDAGGMLEFEGTSLVPAAKTATITVSGDAAALNVKAATIGGEIIINKGTATFTATTGKASGDVKVYGGTLVLAGTDNLSPAAAKSLLVNGDTAVVTVTGNGVVINDNVTTTITKGNVTVNAGATIGGKVNMNGGKITFTGGGKIDNLTITSGDPVVSIANNANFGTLVLDGANAKVELKDGAVSRKLEVKAGVVSVDVAGALKDVTELVVGPKAKIFVANAGLRLDSSMSSANMKDAGGAEINFKWQGTVAVGALDFSTGTYLKPMNGKVKLVVQPISDVPALAPTEGSAVDLITASDTIGILNVADFELDAETAKFWELKTRTSAINTTMLYMVPKSVLAAVISPNVKVISADSAAHTFAITWKGIGGAMLNMANVAVTAKSFVISPATIAVTSTDKFSTITVTPATNATGTIKATLHAAITGGLSGDCVIDWAIGKTSTGRLEGTSTPSMIDIPSVTAGVRTAVISWNLVNTDNTKQPVTLTPTISQGAAEAVATAIMSTDNKTLIVTPKGKGLTEVILKGTYDDKTVSLTVDIAVGEVVNVSDAINKAKLPDGVTVDTGSNRLIVAGTKENSFTLADVLQTGWSYDYDKFSAAGRAGEYEVVKGSAKVNFLNKAGGNYSVMIPVYKLVGGTKTESGNLRMDISGKKVEAKEDSGRGCNAGYLPLVVLFAAPLFFLRKKD